MEIASGLHGRQGTTKLAVDARAQITDSVVGHCLNSNPLTAFEKTARQMQPGDAQGECGLQ